MDQFERNLKAALRRREPSADFTANVMAAIAAEPSRSNIVEMPVRRVGRGPAVFRWAAVGAMAASLAFGVLAIRDQRAERRAAEQAELQLMVSLSVAGSKVSQAADKVWGAPRGD